MNRRFFLRNTVPASLISSVILTSTLNSCGLGDTKKLAKQLGGQNKRVLVVIQLDGGNDGLNTVIPLNQYANLMNARRNILIPEKKTLALNDTEITALHPALTELQELYNKKQLIIIQGVGCEHPDLSHFKAIDVWHSCTEQYASIASGWIGRYLNQEALQYAKNNSDPPAIQIGPTLFKALQGYNASAGMAVSGIDSFYDLPIGHYDPTFVSAHYDQLSFLRSTTIESKEYLLRVKKAAEKMPKNLSSKYPSNGKNMLADQLKTVARLIGGELQTKIYMVNLKGFDTHDNQVMPEDTTKGDHADLLSQLSIAIAAFEDDLLLMGKQDQVLGMTYSEFGRRIASNSSHGCDHGSSAPVILFGTKLKGGLVGNNPIVAEKVNPEDNLAMQHDYRTVYSTILKKWFGANDAEVSPALFGTFPTLDLFKA